MNASLLSGSISESEGDLAAKALELVPKARALGVLIDIRGINRLKDMVDRGCVVADKWMDQRAVDYRYGILNDYETKGTTIG